MRRGLLVLICWCIGANVYAETTICQQRHCLAVVDAGSTGSRLHLFAYDLDSNQHPMIINELWSKKIKPGIATIDPNQDSINAYLNQLVGNVTEQNVPLYFYATAGMRLLPESRQQLYFNALRQWFGSQTQFKLMDVRTITGREEGVFGWIAVNYQLGVFNDSTAKSLVGVMDMGGASVQVTFPVQDVEKIDKHDLLTIDIDGRQYVLFVHSFLGLGQTVLSQQFLDVTSCFANGYKLPDDSAGTGDASACQRDIAQLINNVHEVGRIVKPVMARNANQSWYAIGSVVSLVEDKPFNFEGNQFTNQGLLEKADTEVCHRPWRDLHTEYPDNEYLYAYCLFSSYYYALMVEGYGLQPEQTVNYIPQTQAADWALGVVLHQH